MPTQRSYVLFLTTGPHFEGDGTADAELRQRDFVMTGHISLYYMHNEKIQISEEIKSDNHFWPKKIYFL